MSECEETTASLFSSMGCERCSRTRERGTRVVCTTKHVAIIHSVDLSREPKIKKDVFRTASKTELFRCITVASDEDLCLEYKACTYAGGG